MVTINTDATKNSAAAPGVGRNDSFVPGADTTGQSPKIGGMRNLLQQQSTFTMSMSAEAKAFITKIGENFKERGDGIQLEPTSTNGTYVVHHNGRGILLYFSQEVPPLDVIRNNLRYVPRDYSANGAAKTFVEARGHEIKLLTSPIQILKLDYERADYFAEALRTAFAVEAPECNGSLSEMYSPEDALLVQALGQNDVVNQLQAMYPSRLLPRTEFGVLMSFTQKSSLQNPGTLAAAVARSNETTPIALVSGYVDFTMEMSSAPVAVQGYNGMPIQTMQQVMRYRPLVCISAIASAAPTLLNLILALAAAGGERILNYRQFVAQFDNYSAASKRPNLGYLNGADASGKYTLAADRMQTETILSHMLAPALALDISYGMPNPPALQFLQNAADVNGTGFTQFVTEMNRLFPTDPANAYTAAMGTPLWRVCTDVTGVIGDLSSGKAMLTTEFGVVDMLAKGFTLSEPEKAILIDRRPENEDARIALIASKAGDVTPLFSTNRYLVNPTWLRWICLRMAEKKFVVGTESQQQLSPHANVWTSLTGAWDQMMASGMHQFSVSNPLFNQTNGYPMNMMYSGGYYQQPQVQPMMQTPTGGVAGF